MDVLSYNKKAWNQLVELSNEWTVLVTPEQVAQARLGNWSIVLTPTIPVPNDWFPPLKGAKVLGLASGGGQQGPLLAAAGAIVTILDNSPAQLAQDRKVAEREGLSITTLEGDMADLSVFESNSFDLIIHPCSNCFVPDIKKVWKEAYRVLKKGGTLMSGFTNPVCFAMDPELEEKGIAQFKYKIPYSDVDSLTDQERKRYTDTNQPMVFGHTLEDQIGGQINAGFAITGFYEDAWDEKKGPIHKFISIYIATRAVKL